MDSNLGLPLQPPLNFAEFGAPDSNNLLMVFNGLLITFDIRNIIQWAYLFIRTPVKKLQSIVSSILGHVYGLLYSFMSTLEWYSKDLSFELLHNIHPNQSKLKIPWSSYEIVVYTCLKIDLTSTYLLYLMILQCLQ